MPGTQRLVRKHSLCSGRRPPASPTAGPRGSPRGQISSEGSIVPRRRREGECLWVWPPAPAPCTALWLTRASPRKYDLTPWRFRGGLRKVTALHFSKSSSFCSCVPPTHSLSCEQSDDLGSRTFAGRPPRLQSSRASALSRRCWLCAWRRPGLWGWLPSWVGMGHGPRRMACTGRLGFQLGCYTRTPCRRGH